MMFPKLALAETALRGAAKGRMDVPDYILKVAGRSHRYPCFISELGLELTF